MQKSQKASPKSQSPLTNKFVLLCGTFLSAACSSLNTTLDDSTHKKHNPQLSCLAQAIHGEARGEDEAGRVLVGRVIATRVQRGYGKNYCEVVHAKKQFAPKKNYTPRSFASAQKAHQLGPNGVTHFHSYTQKKTPKASFSLSPKCTYTGKVGGHWTFSCKEGKRFLSSVKAP